MWQLSMRGKDRRLTDLGMFDDIIAATRRILALEGDPDARVSFQVSADLLAAKSDVKILSRLEYQGREGFYTLIRRVQ
jgi:hypothetical protein